MLRVESVTVVLPKQDKCAPARWSKDWQGYLRLRLSDGNGFQVNGLEWSVLQSRGEFHCQFCRSGQLGPTVSCRVTELAEQVVSLVWPRAVRQLEAKGKLIGSWDRSGLLKLLRQE